MTTHAPSSRSKVERSGGAFTPLDLSEIRSYWDGVATFYDGDLDGRYHVVALPHPGLIRAWQLVLARSLGPAPLRVLDVGTGTGNLALVLAACGYDVTAVDTSQEMVVRARNRTKAAGLDLDIRCADAGELPFDNEVFDAVASRLVLWSQPEPERAVTEMARVVARGGRVVTMDGLHHVPQCPLARLRSATAALLMRAKGKQTGFLDRPERMAEVPLGWVTDPTAYRNTFIRAGLERVLIDRLDNIHALERSSMSLRRRLWPETPLYLIEGTVPA